MVVPAYAVGQPITSETDIRRLQKRVEAASRGTVLFGSEFLQQLERYIDKPLTALKREVLERLILVAKRLPVNKLKVDEIVL
jgi:hypothetical protein